MKKLTPLMEQYYRIKKDYEDKILFFRMGDFFEMFDKDAEIVAPILNIALTFRNKKAGMETKMCGVPHHSIAGPISKLLSTGWSVAICDQIEPADPTKSGLVKRAVTRVLTPGMVYDLDSLDQLTANYISAFDKNHISFLDCSTGSAFYYEVDNKSDFFKLLDQFSPRECLVTSSQKEKCGASPFFQALTLTVFDKSLKDWSISPELKQFDSCPESAKRLLYYVFCMQGAESLKLFREFKKISLEKEMYCSRQLFSHLEIFKTYEGSSKDSLFSAINRTKTPSGARLLKKRLKSPLIDQDQIEKRLDRIDFWRTKPELLSNVRPLLAQMGDGERKLGKIVQPTANGRDFLALVLWLDTALQIRKLVKEASLSEEFKKAKTLKDKIQHILSESCPVGLKEGGLINKGVNPQLDEWMELAKSSQTHLLKMEQREQSALNIPSLKIRYNNVFGYYIEVRKTHSSKVPSHYMRKQTLVQAERYTTEELNRLEEKILSARSQQIEMEYKIFQDLRSEVLKEMNLLLKLCDHFNQIDVDSSLAFLAIENKYVRPSWTGHFKLVASRHPVLEQKNLYDFVPNTLDLPAHQTLILTGPNMAGKSTLMRQMALAVLMAQSGCFVPAEKAELPLFHKMFTRIGASDLLSQGLSTFMVEMKETAEILEKADDKSFVILDEIGRGTATFDGMSLAQSILEFLTVEKKPFLLSATHYEELTQLAEKHASISNASMAIREEEEKIHFLYLLKQGPASKSYGIQVARLAGVPSSVVKRASELLQQHESRESQQSSFKKNKQSAKQNLQQHESKTFQPDSLSSSDKLSAKKILQQKHKQTFIDSLIKEISEYSLMTQTPINAMNQIQKWQKKLALAESQKDSKPLKTKTSQLSEQDFFPDILN